MLKWLLISLGSLAASLVLATLIALELNGVITVETVNSESRQPRHTHIWYVEVEDQLMLEAGNPENPWVKDLALSETIVLMGGGLDGVYSFLIHDRDSHDMIRSSMRSKYGWRDWWISLLFDTSAYTAVTVTKVQGIQG